MAKIPEWLGSPKRRLPTTHDGMMQLLPATELEEDEVKEIVEASKGRPHIVDPDAPEPKREDLITLLDSTPGGSRNRRAGTYTSSQEFWDRMFAIMSAWHPTE